MRRVDITGAGESIEAPAPSSREVRPETFMRHIIMDTRQQAGKHELEMTWFSDHGVTVVRCALPFGDYVKMPAISVDTKKDIYELHMDMTKDHDRFARECDGAYENECALTILVKNEDGVTDLDTLSTWLEPMAHFSMRQRKTKNTHIRRMSGATLAKACRTFSESHHVRFMFCKPDECAAIINEILEGRL